MEQTHKDQPIKCALCGSENVAEIFQCRDQLVTDESFHIKKCEACGTSFTWPVPAADEIGRYYQSEEYISHSETRKGLVARLYHLVRARALKSKRKLLEEYSSRGSVLDYGCGTGAFLAECADGGWKTFGVEPDAGARGRVRGDIPVVADLELLPRNVTFSAVTMWHVLEHVHDPLSVLAGLHSFLEKGGALIVAVPNHKSLDALTYGPNWAAYDVPRHLWHFEKSTLKRLVTSQGFEFLACRPMVFDSFYVSMLSEKYAGSALGPLRAFVSGLRSNFKAKRTGEYSSLIYIFRKI